MSPPSISSRPGAVLDFIHQAQASNSKNPFLNTICYPIPRMLHGGKEISEKELVPDIAELHYAIHYEMCLHPSDFFVRRTSNLYFNRENLMSKFEILYPWFVQIAQLNNEVARQYAEQFINEIDLTMDFK